MYHQESRLLNSYNVQHEDNVLTPAFHRIMFIRLLWEHISQCPDQVNAWIVVQQFTFLRIHAKRWGQDIILDSILYSYPIDVHQCCNRKTKNWTTLWQCLSSTPGNHLIAMLVLSAPGDHLVAMIVSSTLDNHLVAMLVSLVQGCETLTGVVAVSGSHKSQTTFVLLWQPFRSVKIIFAWGPRKRCLNSYLSNLCVTV